MGVANCCGNNADCESEQVTGGPVDNRTGDELSRPADIVLIVKMQACIRGWLARRRV